MTVTDSLSHGLPTARLGAVMTRIQDVGHATEPALSVFLDAGVVPRAERPDNHNSLGSDLEKYQLVKPGDLVFNRLRTWQGGFGASRHRGIVSPAYIVARPQGKGDARYLDYVLHSAPYLAELTRVSKWMPPSQFDVLWADLRNVAVPWPEVAEQRRIADFLDDRVSRIDQIVAARRSQAALAQLLFFGASSALMDRAANHYGLAPLRRFCAGIEQGSSPVAEDREPDHDEYGVLKTSAIQGGRFLPWRAKVAQAHLVDERFRVQAGDVLVVRGSGSAELVGDAATVVDLHGRRLYLSDLTYRLRGLAINSEFTTLSIISGRGRSELGARVRQGSGPAKARGEDILTLPVPRAPLSVQVRIVDEASSMRDAHESGARRLTDASELMNAYKRSLITAAVTGELDVTTARSGIPG